jgi:hypothetical protein
VDRTGRTTTLEGFGSKLVHRSMTAQLGGTIAFDWSAEGFARHPDEQRPHSEVSRLQST